MTGENRKEKKKIGDKKMIHCLLEVSTCSQLHRLLLTSASTWKDPSITQVNKNPAKPLNHYMETVRINFYAWL